jgi:hypothetical protein
MEKYIELLEKTLLEPYGSAVLCNSNLSADRLRRSLYYAIAKLRDSGRSDFDDLSISICPHSEDILYIYHANQT